MRGQGEDDVGLLRFLAMIREQPPDERQIAQSRYSREHRALVVADQSREHVRFTVPQADRRRDLAVAEGRQAAESRTGDAAHRQLQRQRDLVVVMGAGGDVDVHPDILVLVRRDRLLVDAAGGDGGERGDRHGHPLTEPRLCGDALRRAYVRIGERPCVRVVLEEPVVDARHARHEHVGLCQVADVLQRQVVAVDVGRSRDALGTGRGDLEAVLAQPRAIDLEQLDVDDDFRPRLVDSRDEAAGGRDPLGRVFQRDRVGRGDGRDLADVHDDAKEIDDLLDVGITEVEDLDDRLLVLAALGRRVGDDGDRPGSRHPIERAGRGGERGERLGQRDVAQVDAQRRVAEPGVEDEIQAGESRHGGEDRARARIAEHERIRERGALRQVESRRGKVARLLDERLKLGLAFARHGQLGPDLLARILQRRLDIRVGRVQFRGELILGERVFVPLGRRQPPAAEEMVLRGAQPRPIEGQARVAIVGVEADDLRVFHDGAVVVRAPCGQRLACAGDLESSVERRERGRVETQDPRHDFA